MNYCTIIIEVTAIKLILKSQVRNFIIIYYNQFKVIKSKMGKQKAQRWTKKKKVEAWRDTALSEPEKIQAFSAYQLLDLSKIKPQKPGSTKRLVHMLIDQL